MVICAYCKNEKELCESHSIPDGIFRVISRANNGKLISIPTDERAIHFSHDTGKAKLLCRDCEAFFNRNFDAPLVNLLKTWDRKIIEEGFGVKIAFCSNQIAQSLVSIFWRSSVSGAEMYRGARVSPRDQLALLRIIKSPRDDVLFNCSCSIRRLYDKTPIESGGFTQSNISGFVLPVTAYSVGRSERKHRHFGFTVVMMGFLCTITIPKLPHAIRSKPGFLRSNRPILHAPILDIFEYKPLLDTMVFALKKHLDGNTRVP
ncbi:MAG: hypothetical protein LWW93_12240 [Hyphomicrobiales bacterium]|nr:hypothetical protein [Hyphomicrobiales bacterium]